MKHLWLIPALPLLSAGLLALTRRPHRRWAASLAIGSMVVSFLLSVLAFRLTLQPAMHEGPWREVFNFTWFQLGAGTVRLGWVLDPLTATMLMMVTFVGALIFIYSVGYMAHDDNFTRFFAFLSLFGAAMLGLVIANNLLLLFICWELVGLASYLLIGFWFHKPAAAAAAKKAFITTRIGDLGLFLGMLFLYAQTGTLLFYDQGNGCLEQTALIRLANRAVFGGVAVSTLIGLLIFCGAMGKSGQVPLHVWLPDAMEGPTPVSALIHAATMVAAGVFLVARVYPLLDTDAANQAGVSTALTVIAWVGSITAVFAASIAVAQSDIKRILAYSTVSQLGYMMLALGVGGYVAGVFHLITHAFFKALLFLGAGSVIHGCHEEQDIRRLGGLRQAMPVTFITYAIGMMALAGVPVVFSGFWSKDEILHAASAWPVSHLPFYLGLTGALLTAFYMTRQICYVFYGPYRGLPAGASEVKSAKKPHHKKPPAKLLPHESPAVMTVPLQILAAGAILLSLIGTPIWPWFHTYLTGHPSTFDLARLFEADVLLVMGASIVVAATGLGAGWWLYGRTPIQQPGAKDALELLQPQVFGLLRDKFRVDEIYEATVIRAVHWGALVCRGFDRWVWEGAVQLAVYLALGFSWMSRFLDEYLVNLGFDLGCGQVRGSGLYLARLHRGRLQSYLRIIGLGLGALVVFLTWG